MYSSSKRLFRYASGICILIFTVGCDPVIQPDQTPQVKTNPPQVVSEEPAESVHSTPEASAEMASSPVQNPPTNEPEAATAEASPYWLRLFAWNVESEGADSSVIASQLSQMGGYDVYGLTEVMPEDFKKFREALGQNYKYAYSRSGFNDRLQLLYNEDRFELVRKMELDEINFEGRYRSPLVIHLRDRESKNEFMVMVNHLARGKAEVRTRQAEQLVEWARGQQMPIIAIGDYNYDFVFATERGNDGFRAMIRDNIWKWVRPTELIDTNWFDPEPDGIDNYPGSLLDFAFVAGQATEWDSTCNIIVREGDFPDNEKTSDHRPYELLVTKQ